MALILSNIWLEAYLFLSLYLDCHAAMPSNVFLWFKLCKDMQQGCQWLDRFCQGLCSWKTRHMSPIRFKL